MAGATPSLAVLRANPENAAWIQALEAARPPATPERWPDDAELVGILRLFAIPEDDVAILQGLYPRVLGSPDLRWIVERYARLLHSRMGQPGYHPLPALPDGFGELGRHLFTFVHALHFPATLAWHQARGIPLSVTRATMADIGRHYLVERLDQGRSGLAAGDRWLTLHARGLIYQFGRLQFEITNLEPGTSDAMRQAGVDCAAGEPVVDIHIPGLMGPFPPDACDAAFAAAAAFFPRHFPELGVRFATCDSWLLDPQLADYLPASSNIVHFQRRFRLLPLSEPNNDNIVKFVFRTTETPLDQLPQRTTLERAVVQHIRDGKTWSVVVGWLPLTPNQGPGDSQDLLE